MKKILTLLILGTLILTGCSNNKDIDNKNSSEQSKPETSSTPNENEPPIEAVVIPSNPFTGIPVPEENLLNRPLAVMINNISASMPQSGIGTADVVFEMPVEGNSSRIMAVFADNTTMPNMGSIRSSRHDFVELIAPFDPLYLHFGYSDSAKNSIETNNISSLNGIKIANIAFFQDQQKLESRASEHTWFSNVDYLKSGAVKEEYSDKISTPLAPMFSFVEGSAMANYPEATAVNSATVRISNGASATFEYNADKGIYIKSQNGKPHIDENIGQAVEVKNVLVMYTNVGYMADNYHKEVDLSKGSGYYISEGKKVDVTFKKEGIDGYLKAYTLDGQELTMNQGNTWVYITPQENKEKEILQ